MTIQTGTPAASFPRRTLALAGATALALATITGVGVWQLGMHSRSSATVMPAASVAAPQRRVAVAAPPQYVAASDASSTGLDRQVLDLSNQERAAHGLPEIVVSDLAQPAASPAHHDTTTPAVYLVATPELASRLRAALADTDAMRSQSGQASLDVDVRVVDATTSNQLQQDIASQNGFRAMLGLPPITVLDLR